MVRLHDSDERMYQHLGWEELENVIDLRADQAGPRLSYCEGTLELTSICRGHGRMQTLLSRLVEAYAEEANISLNGHGSLTLTEPALHIAAEPDECYVVGPDDGLVPPNLVIDVVWTSGGVDKGPLYAAFGIPELWEWRDGTIQVFHLRAGAYVPTVRTVLLPELDLELLTRHLAFTDPTAAVRAFRAALRQP